MEVTEVAQNPFQRASTVTVASEATDEYLAALAASDPAAFAELYHRYVSRIRRYCSRRLRDEDQAEDATSRVFLKALESLQHKRVDNVASWLFSIAHNDVIDRYRRTPQHLDLDDAWNLVSAERSPEDVAIAQSEAADFRRALAHLKPDQQRVIELRLAGLTTAEIQEVLGKRRPWVGTTQHRAVQRLRELMRPPGPMEERP
jgi:RNA polymerase sigma-70 factor (ECF subfamily)